MVMMKKNEQLAKNLYPRYVTSWEGPPDIQLHPYGNSATQSYRKFESISKQPLIVFQLSRH